MKLDPDCIRFVLLKVEDAIQYPGNELNFDFEDPSIDLGGYPWNVVRYHIKQCEMDGLINVYAWFLDGGVSISDLTPAGHRFLADIRSDTTWAKTKDIAKSVGSSSLSSLIQIAAGVVTTLINQHLGINGQG